MVSTLAVDCGGGGIKATVLDEQGRASSQGVRTPTPYPLPPTRLLDVIADLTTQLPRPGRVTVGMPGMIRRGVVVATPHYITRFGPRTRVLPELQAAWSGFDMAAAVTDRLGAPAIVLNDCEVAGAGVVTGEGLELVLTLGTGLGSAIFHDGVLVPHLEFSQAPIKWGLTYDDYLGEHERIRLGDSHWSRRVRTALESLEPVVLWDRLLVGGGNAHRIVPAVAERLPSTVSLIPNAAGLVGGVRAWSLSR